MEELTAILEYIEARIAQTTGEENKGWWHLWRMAMATIDTSHDN